MCYIQKIFDGPWPTGLKLIWPAMNLVEGWIIPLGEHWNIMRRLAQCDPYPIISFLSLINLCSCCSGGFLIWMGRKTNTLPFFIVCPTMICTDQRLVLDFP